MKFNKSKVYVKSLGKISGFKIWLVNGGYIRKELDENFANFDQHEKFKFIPKKEFWIEKETSKKEWDFYITHMLMYARLRAEGMSPRKANTLAFKAQKKERRKSAFFKKIKRFSHPEKLLNKTHYNLLEDYSNGLKIWLVNGEAVRDFFFIDYAFGGHDKVYSFIPKNEIWIEKVLGKREKRFILIHELHERYLMAKYHLTYHEAHLKATILEDHCRKHPKIVERIIKRELKRNKKFV